MEKESAGKSLGFAAHHLSFQRFERALERGCKFPFTGQNKDIFKKRGVVVADVRKKHAHPC